MLVKSKEIVFSTIASQSSSEDKDNLSILCEGVVCDTSSESTSLTTQVSPLQPLELKLISKQYWLIFILVISNDILGPFSKKNTSTNTFSSQVLLPPSSPVQALRESKEQKTKTRFFIIKIIFFMTNNLMLIDYNFFGKGNTRRWKLDKMYPAL